MKLFKPGLILLSALTISLSSCANAIKQDAGGEQNQVPLADLKQDSQVNQPVNTGTAAKPAAPSLRKVKTEEKSSGYVVDKEVDDLAPKDIDGVVDNHNTEAYNRIYDNPFLEARQNPLSTFSIDVDTASYSNLRRFLENKQSPPADAVRIEEMVNYFPYSYPEPTGDQPFSVTTDLSTSPWNAQHKLLRIGLKGKSIELNKLPPQNLVFLLDVSGSMSDDNKLPLLKRSLKLLVDQLREQDRVSIVVYAGAAGMVLPPTNGAKKEAIFDALDRLEAGGSTAGSAGIQLAYETAQKNFRSDANNRVILATDGDFNVGPSSDGELTRMIEEKRKAGIFLTVLGYGMGNYKDAKMEQMADKGNGNYAYIDSLLEARKVLVQEMGGTMQTIAKDVKLQLEFNPTKVKSYRLIGYENRLLAAEDFNDDTKDAGEMGAGTTVTALYEIVPNDGTVVSDSKQKPAVDPLRYQQSTIQEQAQTSNELLMLKLRYKAPNSDTSQLISHAVQDQPINWQNVSQDFRFAAAVAGFGMQLRQSEHKGNWTLQNVLDQAKQGVGSDQQGYRQAFLELVQKSQQIQIAQRPE